MLRTLEDLEPGKLEASDSGYDATRKPIWLDEEKFERGRQFFKKHIFAIFFVLHVSLAVGLCVQRFLNVLVFTRKSHTPEKALKRYTLTAMHLYLWHVGDVWDTNSEAHKSVQTVRTIHNKVAKATEKDKAGDLHLTQYDLAVVQASFFAGVLLHYKKAGIRCSRRELEDYVHFWKGIGYLIGVDDKYNACAGSFEDVQSICKDIQEKLVLPTFNELPTMFDTMSDAYCEAMNLKSGLAMHSRLAVLAYFKDITGVPLPQLSWPDMLRVVHYKFQTFMLYFCPGYEYLLNRVIFSDFKREFQRMQEPWEKQLRFYGR